MPESNSNPSDETNQTPAPTLGSSESSGAPPAVTPSAATPPTNGASDNSTFGARLLEDVKTLGAKVLSDIEAKHEDHKAWLQSVYEEAKTFPVDFDTLKGDLLGEVENLAEVPLLLKLAVIAVKKAQSLDPNAQANFQHLFADLPTI